MAAVLWSEEEALRRVIRCPTCEAEDLRSSERVAARDGASLNAEIECGAAPPSER